jgi:hypothetical protein
VISSFNNGQPAASYMFNDRVPTTQEPGRVAGLAFKWVQVGRRLHLARFPKLTSHSKARNTLVAAKRLGSTPGPATPHHWCPA